MKRILTLIAFVSTFLLSACYGEYVEITEYSDRSVVYGWIDPDQAKGNTVTQVVLNGFVFKPGQLKAMPDPTQAPGATHWLAKHDKFGDGYLFYSFDMLPGKARVAEFWTQNCSGRVCFGNTINVNRLEDTDPYFTTTITGQGVYSLGNYRVSASKGKLIGTGSFELEKTAGPSRKAVLEFLLQEAPEEQKPLIRAALARL